ncbi:aminotransferase class I/II-fold pyridoxal phosphate-dependent enzyme [Pseudomonas sessilinigenes]|uniref:Aminotransferase class I/II-fold pyridoxal phosphate-dependent enzyme n=1 Tax=Pseudomonas sessilinigenes TaxID=658629 RepID=A0ABX8MJC3_9PSED|nr:aminotransferase class I/II-fold pyridoxal phosphate-dependent enzyme [Pseudomonas sessilinigenes]AZC26567.1 N-succinyl-L,L-diaminopimelate aminotransferase, type 2 [Pseudomonas sessilinigenes]QXH39434.1 aminotransferase class I/II-fold pyridoxal phosphate-dependent enzyme [Pseudomonas sessilinigenes]
MNVAGNAFARLQGLLDDLPPAPGLSVIALHLGESRLGDPTSLLAPLSELEDWTRYPPLAATTALREAYSHWLRRRFGIADSLGKSIAIEPTPGTKQAVATCIALAVTRARARGVAVPVVVLPNPFYPTYVAATEAAGARALFYDLCDGQLEANLAAQLALAGDSAATVVLCNPGNPLGNILCADTLAAISRRAHQAQASLLVDECYMDLLWHSAPPGYLSLVEAGRVAPCPFVVLHSLSKRSAAPGLRSGFIAGDPQSIAAYAAFNRSCGVSLAWPTCAASAALWQDEAHVQQQQQALQRNWDMADDCLAQVPGYQRAEAGFFLWLAVADGEATAQRLWTEQSLRVMPGRYLCHAASDASNPGDGFVRLALVHQPSIMGEALRRLRTGLSGQ